MTRLSTPISNAFPLLSAIIVFLLCGCRPTNNQLTPVDGGNGQDCSLYYGESATIYNTAVNLGHNNFTLTGLFAPPRRISSQYLLFAYDDITAFFADKNHDGLLDNSDTLLALTVKDSYRLQSCDNIGHGSSKSTIMEKLGPGLFIDNWLVYFTLGVAFKFEQQDIATAITIFTPTMIEPKYDLRFLVDNDTFPRSAVWSVLGNADETWTLADQFFDRYFFLGLTFWGSFTADATPLVAGLAITYPMDLAGAPHWDSTTDELSAYWGTPTTITRQQENLLLQYQVSDKSLTFRYDAGSLKEVIINYQL